MQLSVDFERTTSLIGSLIIFLFIANIYLNYSVYIIGEGVFERLLPTDKIISTSVTKPYF